MQSQLFPSCDKTYFTSQESSGKGNSLLALSQGIYFFYFLIAFSSKYEPFFFILIKVIEVLLKRKVQCVYNSKILVYELIVLI